MDYEAAQAVKVGDILLYRGLALPVVKIGEHALTFDLNHDGATHEAISYVQVNRLVPERGWEQHWNESGGDVPPPKVQAKVEAPPEKKTRK